MSEVTKFHNVDEDADVAGGNDTVGYCKPPKQHQFKRGQSGNPKGRKPRASYEEDDFPIRRFMMEELSVKIHGKTEKVTTYEAILMKQAAKALSGDNESAKLLLKYSGGLKDFRKEAKQQITEATLQAVREAVQKWQF